MSDDKKPNSAVWVATIGGLFALCGTVVAVIGAPLVSDWLSQRRTTPTPTRDVNAEVQTLVASSIAPPPLPTDSFPSSTQTVDDSQTDPPTSTLEPQPPTITPTPFYPGPPLIALVSYSSGRGVIYTVQVDGSNLHAITPFEYDSDTPSWSSDGQWIYFSANREGNFDIYRMRWDGTDIIRLTSDARDEFWPRISPNGLKIVYGVKLGEDNFQLFMMNPDGSSAQNISNSQMNEERPSWSPDSRWIVFMYCRGPNSPADLRCEIYRMNADGTDEHNITNTTFSEIWPAISPDGTTIAFVANVRSYVSDAVSNIDIFLANSDGTNVRPVTTSLAVDTNPSWSPDGSRIIFKSARDDTSETDIWLISASGQGLFRLTSLPGNETYPAWQPVR